MVTSDYDALDGAKFVREATHWSTWDSNGETVADLESDDCLSHLAIVVGLQLFTRSETFERIFERTLEDSLEKVR